MNADESELEATSEPSPEPIEVVEVVEVVVVDLDGDGMVDIVEVTEVVFDLEDFEVAEGAAREEPSFDLGFILPSRDASTDDVEDDDDWDPREPEQRAR